MIGGPYLALGGGLAMLGLVGSSFALGKNYGENKIEARDAKALSDAVKDRDKLQDSLGQLALSAANRENTRQETVRTIYNEIPKLVTRDIYRNVCIDSDGVQLITRAVKAANGGESGPVATSGPSQLPTATNGDHEGR